MSAPRRTGLAVLLATVTAILGAGAPALAGRGLADSGSPTPLPPDQAQALATSGPESSGYSTSAVDGNTVLAASTLPGAQTAIEGDLTPQQAVGLATFDDGGLLYRARAICWANAAWHQWGTWPYQQRITDTTYWCAVYNRHITYRTSSATGSGTLCATNYAASQLIGGGVGRGFTYFTIRSSAGFACQTVIPWITIHTNHHEDVKRNDVGKTTFVGTG
jgi:hypothetical protein